jgi:hypothetical protein
MKRKRAVSVTQLLNTNLNGLDFAGEWLEAIGRPELTGTWLIWGNSGNGKTRFALQLAKYLTSFNLRVAYDSLEEGVSLSLRTAISEEGMQECSRRFILLDKEPVPELIERLSMRRSADVVIIDSVQYTGMNYSDYKKLRDNFRGKLFILVSHAEGKLPEGRVAKNIRFDAMVKIWVEGYMAWPVSRYGGGEPYIIWEEGAEKCLHPKET